MAYKKQSYNSAFTIVELLVVIVVIGILAAIVIATLRPGEISAQARDSNRVSDINNLKRAIDIFIVDKTDPALLGAAQKVYISIPDTSSTCANIINLPTLPAGWSYNCVTTANLKNINGTGWLPINFTTPSSSPISSLPIDPQNDATLTKYYQYIPSTTSTYELTALMESEKQAKAMSKDGGTDAGRFEVGTDLTLWRTAGGLVGYWNFEEGTSSTATDSSGNSNNGTWYGTGTHYSTGKVGNFAGQLYATSSDRLIVANNSTVNNLQQFTIMGWMKPSTWHHVTTLLGKGPEDVVQHAWIGWWGAYNKTRLEMGDTTSAYGLDGSTGLTWVNNEWHFVAVTFDDMAKICKHFRNGEIAGAATYSARSFNSGVYDISIGSYSSGTMHNVDGLLDEVRMYNRVLSDSEIKSIYNAEK